MQLREDLGRTGGGVDGQHLSAPLVPAHHPDERAPASLQSARTRYGKADAVPLHVRAAAVETEQVQGHVASALPATG